MANQIQATVYQIDGNPQKTPISLSFLTSDIAMREFSGSNIPEVQSAILCYPNASNPLELQTFYVSESMATLLAAANLGITSQVQATILAINTNPLIPAGVTYSFPASGVSIWTNVDATTGINSYLQFKNTRYFASQTKSYLSALANQNQGGSGTVTSIVAGTGITVDSSTPASPIVSIGYTAENVANKSLDVATDGSSDVKYPSVKATKTYTDSLVVGLLNDRGNYTPGVSSPGAFPTTGGSGTAGAIKKGDLWFCSANGYLGTTAVVTGVSFRALIDTPGQTAANWNILNVGLGYTPENVLNKSTSGALGTSDTLYPSQKAVKTYVDTNNTLQVTTAGTNKNLTNGRNFQGTSAGSGTIGGTEINGFGTSAAQANTGTNVNALGNTTAYLNTGTGVNALGNSAARQNSGSAVNALGELAASQNTGNAVNAFINYAAYLNSGDNVNALGGYAAQENSGFDVNAFGTHAGDGNIYSNVSLLGSFAAASANNQLVLSDGNNNARISHINLTGNRTYELPDASGTLALVGSGSSFSFELLSVTGTNSTNANPITKTFTNVSKDTGTYVKLPLSPTVGDIYYISNVDPTLDLKVASGASNYIFSAGSNTNTNVFSAGTASNKIYVFQYVSTNVWIMWKLSSI
jgi:hypothetical protein